eukprot:GHUV01021392.1.p1 GENE.GHUV01021392.1~~GHUV01021392.1.p1  ORF type:complete len:170 (+),score=50.95 GHUV01021392.1:932-1441(+)
MPAWQHYLPGTYTAVNTLTTLCANKWTLQHSYRSGTRACRSKKLRKPNVVKASLYSQALGEFVRLKVTTTALRQIDKAGGLDRYLLKTPDSLLFSDVGSKLKFRLGLTYRHKQYQERQQQLLQQQQQLLPDSAALQKAARLAANSSSSSSKGRTSLLPPAAAAALQANQ